MYCNWRTSINWSELSPTIRYIQTTNSQNTIINHNHRITLISKYYKFISWNSGGGGGKSQGAPTSVWNPDYHYYLLTNDKNSQQTNSNNKKLQWWPIFLFTWRSSRPKWRMGNLTHPCDLVDICYCVCCVTLAHFYLIITIPVNPAARTLKTP